MQFHKLTKFCVIVTAFFLATSAFATYKKMMTTTVQKQPVFHIPATIKCYIKPNLPGPLYQTTTITLQKTSGMLGKNATVNVYLGSSATGGVLAKTCGSAFNSKGKAVISPVIISPQIVSKSYIWLCTAKVVKGVCKSVRYTLPR